MKNGIIKLLWSVDQPPHNLNSEEIQQEMGFRRGFDQGFFVASTLAQTGQTPLEMRDIGRILHYYWRCGSPCKYRIAPPVEIDPEFNRANLKRWRRKLHDLTKIWAFKD